MVPATVNAATTMTIIAPAVVMRDVLFTAARRSKGRLETLLVMMMDGWFSVRWAMAASNCWFSSFWILISGFMIYDGISGFARGSYDGGGHPQHSASAHSFDIAR